MHEGLNELLSITENIDHSKIDNPVIRTAVEKISTQGYRCHYDIYGDDVSYGSDHTDYSDKGR